MVTLQKYFSHPSIVIYFFATPPIKLKLRQQTGRGLLIANHLDESLWWANQKHWAAVGSYLLHSFFCRCTVLQRFFTSHRKLCNYAQPKPIFLSQTGTFWLFFIQFYCAGSHTEHWCIADALYHIQVSYNVWWKAIFFCRVKSNFQPKNLKP